MKGYNKVLTGAPAHNLLYLQSDAVIAAHTPNGRASGTIAVDRLTGITIHINADTLATKENTQ